MVVSCCQDHNTMNVIIGEPMFKPLRDTLDIPYLQSRISYKYTIHNQDSRLSEMCLSKPNHLQSVRFPHRIADRAQVLQLKISTRTRYKPVL